MAAAEVEQKKAIAAYFLQSSPCGEIDEVLSDVKKLAGDEVITEEFLISSLAKYNVENFVSGADPEGQQVLVSLHGQVDQDSFLDPATGRVMKFDHKSRRFTSVTEKKQVLDESVNKYRVAIEKEVKTYVEGSYKTGKVVSAVYGADNGTITVCISAANVHLGNFWTGGWRSCYQLSVASEASVDVKSDVKINVHYFEDGNVQLHTKYPAKISVKVADEKSTAAALIKAIKQLETDFQANLEQMYLEMHKDTFKQMRRFYPVSKQPMNWNIAAHKMQSELGSS